MEHGLPAWRRGYSYHFSEAYRRFCAHANPRTSKSGRPPNEIIPQSSTRHYYRQQRRCELQYLLLFKLGQRGDKRYT